MRIVESYWTSKAGDPVSSEDRYCVTEHYACVIDGATDVSGKRYRGQTSGQLIAALLEEGIRDLPPKAEIGEIIRLLNKRLLETYKEMDIYNDITENAHSLPSAAMVLYSRYHNRIWMIGDCQCMLDGKLHTNEKVVDTITAEARSLFLEAELLRGKTIEGLLDQDTGFEAILPFLQAQYEMQNTPVPTQFGYIAMTGFEFDLSQIKTVNVDPDVKFLILASDGYPRVRTTLLETEAELQQILDKDPLCFREYKLAKGLKSGNSSFDDRTYVKLELTT